MYERCDFMKILSIGNSFSQDAHKWLHKLAITQGQEMETVNLYIGGCSLQTHWENVVQDRADYDLEINGGEGMRKISIREALEMDQWDVITLQQVSHLSGIPESYEPYFSMLLQYVKAAQPEAKIWFHETWAYEQDSQHPNFPNYDRDQRKMYACVIATTDAVSAHYQLPKIPTGRAIQYLRENVAEFDYQKTGFSLCRDGFHMSYDYGRYAAACVWYVTLTGSKIVPGPFEDFDGETLRIIANTINRVCG